MKRNPGTAPPATHSILLVRRSRFPDLFRCQLAELALHHFQRLCDSSLALLRANVTDHIDAQSQAPASSQLQHATRRSPKPNAPPPPPPPHHNFVQEAGELLAGAAQQWAAEDVACVAAGDVIDVDSSSITLLDEIHRLRLQLSQQHMRVINSYAEGIKHFEQRSSAAT
jgi:hypothetical protein